MIGAGGIGAVIAAAAADSGHDVTVCVRTPIESLILERSPTVGDQPNQPNQPHPPNPPEPPAAPEAGARLAITIGATIASRPSQLSPGPADVVWLTTKAGDSAAASSWFGALCGPTTVVAVAQNGLDHHARIAPLLPPGSTAQLVPALAYMAAERLSPGRVRHLAGDRLVVPDEVVPVLAQSVAGGGLVVRGTADIHSAAWQKLLSNVVANPITALTLQRIPVMKQPGMADVARLILEEAIAVGRADGAILDDRLVESVISGTGRYGDETGSSMLYDRMDGRPLEHRYLTGEVVRRGHLYGVAVPVNTTILALLDAIDRNLSEGRSPA